MTALNTGRMPSRQLADAALVLVGGTLLLTPGFLTDIVGFFLILPPTRPLARRGLEAMVARRLLGGFFGGGGAGGPGGRAVRTSSRARSSSTLCGRGYAAASAARVSRRRGAAGQGGGVHPCPRGIRA